MNLFKNSLLIILSMLLMVACKDESFMLNEDQDHHVKPYNLMYSDIINAREYSHIQSNMPTISSGGIPCFYEIVSARGENGPLDESYMQYVSVENPKVDTMWINIPEDSQEAMNGDTVYAKVVIDPNGAGTISIANGNNFGIGDYSFTIKATSYKDGDSLQTVFDDVFNLNVAPLLPGPKALSYCPTTENLIIGTGKYTSEAVLGNGNPDVRYELASHQDKLVIDSETGAIGLADGYTVSESEEIQPAISVISNISEEGVTYLETITVIISNEPVIIEPARDCFFYPSMEATNVVFGYKRIVVDYAGIKKNQIWTQEAPSDAAAGERLDEAPSTLQSVATSTINQWGSCNAHESWVVMNSQNLTQYSYGYCWNLKAVFWIKNSSVEYLPDGTTPADLEIYVSSDYDENVANSFYNATWTQVNHDVICKIDGSNDTFMGTPYPGDQEGVDPDGRKDPIKNADDKWVKCEMDLDPYKSADKFSIAFRLKTYFTGVIKPKNNEGCSGKFAISDVYYLAEELIEN
ncbi:hypothetical protein E9993_00785 [Labilibacter sediminis]|nr:hypothetical protein E9993_00785 [Labilibacter sediminis]